MPVSLSLVRGLHLRSGLEGPALSRTSKKTRLGLGLGFGLGFGIRVRVALSGTGKKKTRPVIVPTARRSPSGLNASAVIS